jgi:hypothetical protein
MDMASSFFDLLEWPRKREGERLLGSSSLCKFCAAVKEKRLFLHPRKRILLLIFPLVNKKQKTMGLTSIQEGSPFFLPYFSLKS